MFWFPKKDDNQVLICDIFLKFLKPFSSISVINSIFKINFLLFPPLFLLFPPYLPKLIAIKEKKNESLK